MGRKKNKTKKSTGNNSNGVSSDAADVKFLVSRLNDPATSRNECIARMEELKIMTGWKHGQSDDYKPGDRPIQISDGDQTSFRQKLFLPEQREALKALCDYQTILRLWLLEYDEYDRFEIACVLGDVDFVKSYVEDETKDLISRLEFRETPLRLSSLLLTVAFASRRDLQQLKINELKSMESVDPTIYSHEPDNLGVAKLLLEHGALPDAKDFCGNTVCHYLCNEYCNTSALKIIQECILASKSSAYMNQRVVLRDLSAQKYNGQEGVLGGYHCTDQKSESGRRVVILKGRTISLQPKNLFTTAAEDEGLKCILTDYNLANETNRLGSTCLHNIVETSKVDTMKYLLIKHNARVDIKDCNGISVQSKVLSDHYQGGSSMQKLVSKYAKQRGNTNLITCRDCGKIEDESYLCGKCMTACYCNNKCQLRNWENHKKHCKGADERAIVLSTTEPITEFPGDGYEADQFRWVTFRCTEKECKLSDPAYTSIFDVTLKNGTPGHSCLALKALECKAASGKILRVKVSFDVKGVCTLYPDSVTNL